MVVSAEIDVDSAADVIFHEVFNVVSRDDGNVGDSLVFPSIAMAAVGDVGVVAKRKFHVAEEDCMALLSQVSWALVKPHIKALVSSPKKAACS